MRPRRPDPQIHLGEKDSRVEGAGRDGERKNCSGHEEWPGPRHSGRRRQGKNSLPRLEQSTRKGWWWRKNELKRLARARPRKIFTIRLGLSTCVVVWAQGATERWWARRVGFKA